MNTISISQLRRALMACVLAATATASFSHALAQAQVLQVKVPFTFHSGSQHMAAGVYRVKIESDHVISIRGESGIVFVMSNPETARTAPNTGKLIFERYGDEYFLREVWSMGSTTGQRCVRSRQEKEAELAQTHASAISRELALNQLPR